MNDLQVKDLMTRTVVTLDPGDSVPEAARRLAGNNISAAPVVEGGVVRGIVSEADVLGALASSPAVGRKRSAMEHVLSLLTHGRRSDASSPDVATVREAMTAPAITISPEASVWEAAWSMKRHSIKRLPVTDRNGRILGMLSRADLVRALARNDEAIRAEVVRCTQALGEASAAVDVDVEDGTVTLSGNAPDAGTVRLLREMAGRVPGVVAVESVVVATAEDLQVTP
jgi:CBS domain-containing protein